MACHSTGTCYNRNNHRRFCCTLSGYWSRWRSSGILFQEALIGRTAIVEEDIVAETNSGRIAIDGDRWKAVSEDGNKIAKGEKVVVLKVDSIILTVRKA